MENIGEINLDKVVLDCKNPVMLSDFYVKLLGWHKGYETDDFIIIGSEKCNVNIGFQRNELYVAPVWPEEVNKQQQMLHLDFSMEKAKLQEWINYALELGARQADIQYGEWAVMLDPEGHPFCFDVV
ncbi:VOC family protein [Mobilitalea sibirica]|uniref:VOC family protein n=1 Tax=Mobilitalea sibirica TaxID=1462919 RepID=A0A8J7H1N6_9FIRM|nr:VOC family protein [Mobilitalea sibirica]MBH1940378.1 VOC family protein [Mobilitalea sibirica]